MAFQKIAFLLVSLQIIKLCKQIIANSCDLGTQKQYEIFQTGSSFLCTLKIQEVHFEHLIR